MERITGDVMIGSPSSEGKMVIKLKIPKLEADDEIEGEKSRREDVIGILSSKTEKRVCLECKKEFRSGKALGGHMRVHVLHLQLSSANNKNPKFLKQPATNFKKTGFNNGDDRKPYYMNSVNDEGKPTCCQCGKTFPSMKSLFGHMRCHPERIWRGILPPPTVLTRPRNIDDDVGSTGDQVIDLTKFLRGWPVTERRGRKSVKPADDDDDEVLLEAVEDLMSLAHGGASMEVSGVTQRQYLKQLPEKLELDDVNSAYKCATKIKRRRKKMKLMMELEETALTSVPESQLAAVTEQFKSYKCTTCNKCFASHQALGGHRSSHIKSMLTSTDHHHHQLEDNDYDSMLMNRSGENLVHECKICKQIFATGQALGMHQRCHCHWTGTSEEQAQGPSSQITSTGEAGSPTGSCRKVLDFDLNVVPSSPMMEEEEEDEAANVNVNGNGNGYASSSYNSNMG